MGTFNLNDKVIMKKPHACGTNEGQITRMGVDIKIKCINCGREVMLDRLEFQLIFTKYFIDDAPKSLIPKYSLSGRISFSTIALSITPINTFSTLLSLHIMILQVR